MPNCDHIGLRRCQARRMSMQRCRFHFTPSKAEKAESRKALHTLCPKRWRYCSCSFFCSKGTAVTRWARLPCSVLLALLSSESRPYSHPY